MSKLKNKIHCISPLLSIYAVESVSTNQHSAEMMCPKNTLPLFILNLISFVLNSFHFLLCTSFLFVSVFCSFFVVFTPPLLCLQLALSVSTHPSHSFILHEFPLPSVLLPPFLLHTHTYTMWWLNSLTYLVEVQYFLFLLQYFLFSS